MGAELFVHTAQGDTAKEAFQEAVEEAAYEYGHGGYTGTVAEKIHFEMVKPLEEEHTRDTIDRLIEGNDKWGPAYCLQCDTRTYVFFGWASS